MTKVILIIFIVIVFSAFALVLEPEGNPEAKKPDFVLTIKVGSTELQSSERVIYGDISLSNHSGKALQITSHGSWLQFADFIFFDTDGKYIGKSNYGDAHYLYDQKTVTESLARGKQFDSTVAPLLPKGLMPGTYFVQASFDYEELHLRSNRLRFAIRAK